MACTDILITIWKSLLLYQATSSWVLRMSKWIWGFGMQTLHCGGWTRWPLKVPSYTNSMILWSIRRYGGVGGCLAVVWHQTPLQLVLLVAEGPFSGLCWNTAPRSGFQFACWELKRCKFVHGFDFDTKWFNLKPVRKELYSLLKDALRKVFCFL